VPWGGPQPVRAVRPSSPFTDYQFLKCEIINIAQYYSQSGFNIAVLHNIMCQFKFDFEKCVLLGYYAASSGNYT
jgi:hypothetical protein